MGREMQHARHDDGGDGSNDASENVGGDVAADIAGASAVRQRAFQALSRPFYLVWVYAERDVEAGSLHC